MKVAYTIGLLVLSNAFMTLAWYGHLRFKDFEWAKGLGLFTIILISWGMAFFEYVLAGARRTASDMWSTAVPSPWSS